ncbi:MAG: hypothetical protein COA45_06455 [Zetaproteobacteria bacterium]|nr:MAG: hypothetical protein COA45_06455 [Zetaproteobacteria bacterium]
MPSFKDNSKPTIGNMLEELCTNNDYIFIGDVHTNNNSYEFLARPEVMQTMAKCGVTVIDTERLMPEVVHVIDMYNDNKITSDTMKFFVTDMYGTINHENPDLERALELEVSIIEQAKELGISIRSSNHMFPDLSEKEFAIQSAYEIPLLEHLALMVNDIPNFSKLSDQEQILRIGRTKREFRKENPELYNAKLQIEEVTDSSTKEIAKFPKLLRKR